MTNSPRHNDKPATRRGDAGGTSEWYRMTGAGVEFVVAILLFGGIGYGLDRWLDTEPWLLITGCALGFATGLWILIKLARRTFRD